MHFYGLISKLVVLLITEQCSAALRLKAKKNLPREVYLLARLSHVKLITETRVSKKYSTGNEEWIEFETATITSDYVLHNHLSIS